LVKTREILPFLPRLNPGANFLYQKEIAAIGRFQTLTFRSRNAQKTIEIRAWAPVESRGLMNVRRAIDLLILSPT